MDQWDDDYKYCVRPQVQIDLLDYFFPKIYGEESDCDIEKVKTLCKDLVRS